MRLLFYQFSFRLISRLFMVQLGKHLTNDDFFNSDYNIFTHLILHYEDPGPHSHDFIEFFYVLGGQCLHNLNKVIDTVSIGDACLLTPTDSHTFKNIDYTFLHRDIIFKTDYFKAMCRQYSENLYDKLESGEWDKHFTLNNQQMNYLEEIVQPATQPNNPNIDLITGNVCSFIINALIEHNLKIAKNKSIPWISRLLALLSTPENFKTDLQILLSAFPYSKEHICRTFKKATGKSLTDYFNEQKLQYAHTLLQSSTLSVEQICETLNFSSNSYFYHLYKKHFNFTPRCSRTQKHSNKE